MVKKKASLKEEPPGSNNDEEDALEQILERCPLARALLADDHAAVGRILQASLPPGVRLLVDCEDKDDDPADREETGNLCDKAREPTSKTRDHMIDCCCCF